jgi:hypothetical protein
MLIAMDVVVLACKCGSRHQSGATQLNWYQSTLL